MGKENRGFASMDKARQREIASKGGKAAHARGTAHEFTSEEAREAGRKGGMVSIRNRVLQRESCSTDVLSGAPPSCTGVSATGSLARSGSVGN